ncbi:MAG: single-stranded-DNA-specific exonuclease RecJ [Proteobacteria bacterium]|nr:single-stranded-DNA-specific exonuclease RecJ [Pseudomonadota bacterium]
MPDPARSTVVTTGGGAAEPFLGVERSLAGKLWRARLTDDRAALALSQRHGLSELLGRVLAARGVASDAVEDFLTPSLRAAMPDPSRLKDMDAAAARLAAAVQSGEKIAVFADYDVDGATSAAVLFRFLSAVGTAPLIYVPDRVIEGYGPNAEALLGLQESGAKLVLTVDCGITAHEPLAAAAAAGLEIVVVDHHTAEAGLPPATAIVNPNRLDDDSGQGQLAAVGVVFLLVVAINRALRAAGWYAGDRREPDLLGWLDLVALGTVCDVVPLTGINRALVTQGLKVMARRANPGLAALADVAGVDEKPGAYHAGFVLGPRVNAGGRVGEAGLGARLLTTEDPDEARTIAERLDLHNRERQTLEARVLEEAGAAIEDAGGPGAAVFVAGRGWHPGVIGIVASRLAETYNRPACVVALDNGIGKGSGRSVPGVGLGGAILAARQAGLLIAGGGHPMAAGFTVAEDKIEAFRAFLDERIGGEIEAKGVVPELRIDGALALAGANWDLVQSLEALAPFGQGNAEPVFVLRDVRIAKSDVVGLNHVRCFVTSPAGGRLKAIAFRALETPLGNALLDISGASLHLAGRLRPDTWQGREDVQLVIIDAAKVR